MSSIRLFILSYFAEHGPIHGHAVRMMAEKMQAPLWTDISVGAVYGAINRLAAEGLLKEVGTEREGNRPTRQLYQITEDGRRVLEELRRKGLSEIWFKHDPFDLALTRMDKKTAKTLPAILTKRLEGLKALLRERKRSSAAHPNVPLAKQWVFRHTEARLEAEVAYLTDLLKVADKFAGEKPLALPK